MTHSYVWHDLIHMSDMTHSFATCLIHTCDMTHSHVWHDSFICVTWRMLMCDVTYSPVWHDSFTYVTWLIQMCDKTHAHVGHDSFTCVTWLIHTCKTTHLRVWHDSFVCVTWPHSHVWHDPFICDLSHSYMWHSSFMCVTWHIRMCDMTHSYVWQDAFSFIRVEVPSYLIHKCDTQSTHSTHSTHSTQPHTPSRNTRTTENPPPPGGSPFWHVSFSRGGRKSDPLEKHPSLGVLFFKGVPVPCAFRNPNIPQKRPHLGGVPAIILRQSRLVWHLAHSGNANTRDTNSTLSL